jgi:hypothetical protein
LNEKNSEGGEKATKGDPADPTLVSSASKKMEHGFSIFFQKKKKTVCVSFATKDDDQAYEWVRMIQECHPCKPKSSQVETFAQFMENCDNGDILLFRGKKINNKLLRGITGSKYDHVGLVINSGGKKYLFDATGDGICLHTFKKFQKKNGTRRISTCAAVH